MRSSPVLGDGPVGPRQVPHDPARNIECRVGDRQQDVVVQPPHPLHVQPVDQDVVDPAGPLPEEELLPPRKALHAGSALVDEMPAVIEGEAVNEDHLGDGVEHVSEAGHTPLAEGERADVGLRLVELLIPRNERELWLHGFSFSG